MSLFTTPLQIGYFFGLLMWVIFLFRGFQEQRLSDKLLGWIMFFLAMELQDYTFGFAGINVWWNELNGFPRGVQLLFGPMVYFYFKAQVNRSFVLEKKHLWHFVPYMIYFIYGFSAFVRGSEAVQEQFDSTLNEILNYIFTIIRWVSYGYYLTLCLGIYKKYRIWSSNQYSNLEIIDFQWFRNFIYAMIFWLVFREVMNFLDFIFDLDFYQDWWWNLALVAVTLYIGLAGYEQSQPAKIAFEISKSSGELLDNTLYTAKTNQNIAESNQYSETAQRLKMMLETDKLFIHPNLSLGELALHLELNPTQISATINQEFGLNFNDYINGYRIEEFLKRYTHDAARKYTLLSVALDSGFNSKATFNRAFKKIKGCSPKEYLDK